MEPVPEPKLLVVAPTMLDYVITTKGESGTARLIETSKGVHMTNLML